jgi:hypothetical protein
VKVATRLDFDILVAGGCTAPGCKHEHDMKKVGMVLICKCTCCSFRAIYRKGILTLECAACKKIMGGIKIAEP